MNEYKEFLKHLGINPMLMVADMRSRLPDSKKPMSVSKCKEIEEIRKEVSEEFNMTDEEKQKQLIKKIVTENFSCAYCKELGMFDDCNAKKKSCEQILSDWFDKVMEQGK